MNNWDGIKQFYAEHKALILNSPPDEWAIPAYSWDPLVNMTPIERWLWDDIRDANVVMYPQWPIDNMFLDFANPAALVAIECDGQEFHKDKAKDQARDARLESKGWTVYRIPGWMCATEYDHETHELGDARKFIDGICEKHPVKRLIKNTGWISFGRQPVVTHD